MGYRFGGSLTYYPVEYFTGINQLDLLIEFALTGKNSPVPKFTARGQKVYCIFPMHVRQGVIKKILGLDELLQRPEIYAYVPFHLEGDVIENWGSAKQVFCYIHFLADSREDAEKFIDYITASLSVIGEDGEQMLYNIYRGQGK